MATLASPRRVWRPLLLLVVGAALGATFLAPVAARVTASPKGSHAAAPAATATRSTSCAGLDFYPTDSAVGYHTSGEQRYSIGSVGTFRCHLDLPNGAVVTKVQFTLNDAEPFGDVHDCQLDRLGLVATSVVREVMADIPNSAGLNGVGRVTTTSITDATVNNAKFAYWLECTLNPDSALGIYGGDVIYTISAANR